MNGNETFKNTALITGGSEGIGREFACLLAGEGYDLVLVARNEARLSELAGELSRKQGASVKVISKDLTVPSAADEIYEEVIREGINVTLLVNNAGYGIYGDFNEMSLAEHMDALGVLLVSPTKLTSHFMGDMLKNGSGKVLNVCSVAGFCPCPKFSMYGASKAFINSMSEAIGKEVEGTGVTMTLLIPGTVNTEFFKKSQMRHTMMSKFLPMKPETVARIGYQAMMEGKKRVVPGIHNKVLMFSRRILPTPIAIKLGKFFCQ